MATKKVAISLSAGYEKDITLIFRGTIDKYSFHFDSATSRLELSCSDGGLNLKEAVSDRYYPVGTNYSKIVRDLSKDLGLPLGIPITADGKTKGSSYFTGSTSVNLLRLAKMLNCDFSVQDGSIMWLPENKRLDKEAYRLTATTGLIGEVKAYNSNNESPTNDKSANKPGIKLTSLLNGRILPHETIYVESSDGRYKGYYKVTEVSHMGEYEGRPWYTNITAINVEGNIVVL